MNNGSHQKNNVSEFIGNIHTKIFEIILISAFIICLILLIIHLVLTVWFFIGSDAFLAIEIIILLLNFLSLIISIILRYFRSNDSVLKNNYSISYYISIICSIFVIINFLFSFIMLILFSLLPNFTRNDENSVEKYKFMLKIMNKQDKMYKGLDENTDIIKMYKILRSMTFTTFIINLIIYLISFILVFLVIKRIKNKSHYGLNSSKKDKENKKKSESSNRKKKISLKLTNNNNKHKKDIKNKKRKSKEFKEQPSELKELKLNNLNKKNNKRKSKTLKA